MEVFRKFFSNGHTSNNGRSHNQVFVGLFIVKTKNANFIPKNVSKIKISKIEINKELSFSDIN